MVSFRRTFAFVGLLSLSMIPNGHAAERNSAGAKQIDYNRDVRAILSENCYACHGPDQNKRKAGLRLDQREDAFKKLESGSTAIVPGQSGQSEVIRRITTADDDDHMPPAKSGKKLTPIQIDTLRQWIDQGAVWSGHWAYTKPQRPAVPEVKGKTWARNEIDRFVLRRIESEGLKPSPEVSKEKLARRVSFDLTGLPPTVEEVDAFLYDNSADAYEKLVDRLLKSDHYGERMAQFWLDLARFADSAGYHHDSHRDMWHWRDWVIKAFNKNMPFDQFTIEQLAGDLLPNPTRDQLTATGFNRNEMTTAEGGADPNEYSVKYVVGRVDTTSRVWLGTSMACAECHDHKYDPISQKEYYQFFAYFNTIAENGLDQQENPVPRLTLDTPEQKAKVEQFTKEIAALDAAYKSLVEAPHPERDAAQAEWSGKLRRSTVTNWTALEPSRTESEQESNARSSADSSPSLLEIRGGDPSREFIFETHLQNITGVRLELFPSPEEREGNAAGKSSDRLLTNLEIDAADAHPEEAVPENLTPTMGHWYALGPFKAGTAKEAFEKTFGPEKGVDLQQSYEGGKLKWKEQAGWADGAIQALMNENSATYLYRTIDSAEARLAKVSLGSGGGLQAWWNGRRILSKDVTRSAAADQDVVMIHLKKGENKILLKISSGTGPSAFYFKVLSDPVRQHRVEFAAAAAELNPKDHPVSAVIDGKPETGWAFAEGKPVSGQPRLAYFRTHDPFGFKEGTQLKVRMGFSPAKAEEAYARVRLAVTTSEGLAEFFNLPDSVRAALIASDLDRTAGQQVELQKYYRTNSVVEVQELGKLLSNQRKAKDDFVKTIPVTMIMQEMEKPRDTFVLVRGSFQNKGEKVGPGVPQKIFPLPANYPANRLGLAKWLVHPDHPLVSRVTVNHFWQQYFGTGLVKTAEDFGSQGLPPADPELLDWLATEFIRLKWDVKAMQRLIVTSATYRQDSQVTSEHLQRDPENHLLARFPRTRLEAEGIRDTVLSVSGLLDEKIGGPSAYPYQPPGLWEAVAFENSRKYIQSVGAENYRRGLYVYWRRSIPYPSMVAFDAPNRETCTVKRPRTNTPLQALSLMNDPVYVEAARAFAQRIMRDGGADFDSRLNLAFRICLSRRPTKAERQMLERSFQEHFKTYERDRVAAAQLLNVGASKPPVELDICELAAWTVIANTLLNLDETITKS